MTEYALMIKLVDETSSAHSFNPYAYIGHSWSYFDIQILRLAILYLRNNSRMPGSMLILTWVGIIFVIILHRATAFRQQEFPRKTRIGYEGVIDPFHLEYFIKM